MKRLILLTVLLFTAAVTIAQETRCSDIVYLKIQRFNYKTEKFEFKDAAYTDNMTFCMSSYHVEFTNNDFTYIHLLKAVSEKHFEDGSTVYEFDGVSKKGEKYTVYIAFNETLTLLDRMIVSILDLEHGILVDYHVNPF